MMTHDPSKQHHPTFIVADDFLETAFERRFQGILRHAWQNRSWHIIAALPGSGKSWGIGDLVLQSGACKEATGITRLPILAIRAPSNSARELALATALAAAFGIIPKMAVFVKRNVNQFLIEIVTSFKEKLKKEGMKKEPFYN